jgi:hypothetical protein
MGTQNFRDTYEHIARLTWNAELSGHICAHAELSGNMQRQSVGGKKKDKRKKNRREHPTLYVFFSSHFISYNKNKSHFYFYGPVVY